MTRDSEEARSRALNEQLELLKKKLGTDAEAAETIATLAEAIAAVPRKSTGPVHSD